MIKLEADKKYIIHADKIRTIEKGTNEYDLTKREANRIIKHAKKMQYNIKIVGDENGSKKDNKKEHKRPDESIKNE